MESFLHNCEIKSESGLGDEASKAPVCAHSGDHLRGMVLEELGTVCFTFTKVDFICCVYKRM